MAFCTSCGKKIDDGVKFCPHCGKGSGADSPAQGAQDEKTMAIIAYILFFIPLLTGAHKTSPFVKFHTNQGAVLFIVTIGWSIAHSIITAILRLLFSGTGLWSILGGLISLVLGLVWLVPTVLCILGIMSAVKNETKPLPIISKFTIIK
jgi:uncharacterized membrane protein